jgi:hypothetical protein
MVWPAAETVCQRRLWRGREDGGEAAKIRIQECRWGGVAGVNFGRQEEALWIDQAFCEQKLQGPGEEVARGGAQQCDARRVTNVEKRRIGILQTELAKALHSTALREEGCCRREEVHWRSANRSGAGPRSTVRHKVGKVGEATQGNLDSTNHAKQGVQGFTRAEITVTKQDRKSFEMTRKWNSMHEEKF